MEEKKAVALKYEREKDNAPKVLAKGKGIIAEKIVELAKKHDIPVIEDNELVSFLVSLDLGEEIPPSLYKAVAKVLALVYSATRQGYPSK
ncbi:EscU/YscU/HrcU family type III secretion system export apparatus switch protein [Phorcysia thermohydrogeniphila]|uniref:Flagellar biosynthesis protein n=1 Tax=Phorcysia thermohydrogeniphila TaxID=936138 RepID=A0A4R1GHM9_9BACT|nr:EscU/YscU/HrcU family type III secretion system export apparatus switch protein [Phorcysia thermohydrogeniphila]TCK06563.1 flagellar biosynthesis protein [Phorcysia thermohydrogeniphila]